MSVLVVLLKLRNQFLSADNVLTDFVILIVLPLDHLQSEVLFAQLVVAGQVEVESARGDWQSRGPIHYLEGSLDGDLVLIEPLCS